MVEVRAPHTWRGIFPAALTMFDGDGRLDLEASADHVRYLLEEGAHGVVIAGTSGEFISLSMSERTRLFEACVEAVDGRVPVIGGTGAFSTDETVELTLAAAEVGVDAALLILPYYQKPSRLEVLEHFESVRKRVPVPLLLYNNPANSGTAPLGAEDIARLAREDVIVGVKSTFPSVHQIHEVKFEAAIDFRVFYGSFMAPLEALCGGADGWISGILNVVTADGVALWDAVQDSDLDAARRALRNIVHYKYLYTRQPLGPVSDLALYRGILKIRGQHSGYSRRPLSSLSHEQMQQLERSLSCIARV